MGRGVVGKLTCIYTPSGGLTAIYDVQSGEVTGPGGVKSSIKNSTSVGQDGWKAMLAPTG